MNVPTSNMWKSASASLRQPVRGRDANLHLGETMRDLFRDDHKVKMEGRFASLLDRLDHAEKSTESSSN